MNAPRSLRLLLAGFAMLLAPPLSAQTTSTPLALPGATPAAAPESSAGTGPRVALDTSLGRIVVELYPDKAPRAVANFLRYVRDAHYNGTVFHRVIADLLIQGGAFTPDLEHKPERAPIANEANNGLSNLRGTLSAARRPSTSDSAAAQFFINTVDNRQFDFRSDASPQQTGYCVFGRVVEGIEVVDKIRVVATAARKPFNGDVPTTAVVIEHATVIEP